MTAAASPDAYVAALDGWRRACVTKPRAAVRSAGDMEEVIKWGNLVYLGRGPILVIRAEDERATVRRLVEKALELDAKFGDPTRVVRRRAK